MKERTLTKGLWGPSDSGFPDARTSRGPKAGSAEGPASTSLRSMCPLMDNTCWLPHLCSPLRPSLVNTRPASTLTPAPTVHLPDS